MDTALQKKYYNSLPLNEESKSIVEDIINLLLFQFKFTKFWAVS